MDNVQAKKCINKQDFLSFIVVKKHLSQNSVRHSIHRYNVFSKWLRASNKKLNKQTVEEFFIYLLNERHLKTNSVNTYIFFLAQLNAYCKDRGILEGFFDGFKSFPKTRPHIEILATEEIEKLINIERTYANRNGVDNSNLGFRYGTLIMFIAFTVCRLNEAASLRIEHIDLIVGKALFTDTKNRESREVFLAEPLISRIKSLVGERGKEELVFLSSTGRKIVPQAFEHELKLRAKIVGITKRVYPHLFRHSFATQLLMSGVDITVVASILGHKDIQTTFANYVHLADKTRRQGMFRHPLIRKSIAPSEVINGIKETLKGYNLEGDQRFNFTFTEKNGGIFFSVMPTSIYSI